MSEEEISALVGATGRTFRHSGEAIELFSAATEAERTQERLIATATLNNLMDKALRGDAGAERSLAALGFFADTIPSDIKKESLSRTSEKLREEVRQAQTEQQAAAENLRVVWSQSGDKLIQAAKEAEEERLAAVGLQPLVPSQEAGAAPPTLAEVASDLQAKREQLDLLEQAVGGKSEVLQELREKHGVNYQAWQKDQIEEYAEAVEKQVREAESRFNAMRAAQAGRERALQAEWGEQLQQLTEEARAVQGKAAELETLQGKIERHERVSPEEFRRLEVELAPGRKVEEAVAAEQVGVENELASVNARLEDLKAAGPTSGQALAEKVAGVEVAPRVAPKDLSQPEFNWEVLGGMETGERMLTVQESQVRLREELAQLNKLAAGDEEAGQYWQEKGAPAVWKREDMEAATTSREEILRQLETRGKEWLPEYEQWRKGAVESYQEALFDKELGAKEPGALLGKLDAPSEKQAIRRAEETYLQAKEDVALMEAVDSTQDKLTQGGVPADLRAAPRGVGDSAAPEFVQAKADLGDWEKKSKSEQAFKVFTTEARMREEMDLLSRAVGGDEESRLELQRRGAPVAWKPEEMATALKNREETYRQLEPKMEPLKKDFEKWAAGVQHRYESLQGYANQPDLLTQVYNLPLEEAEKKHTEVLAQAQADIKTVRQFHQADYTLRHYNRPLDLQAPERWAGVAMTETEAVMPYAQPERLEEVASAYLRDDQRRQGGWEVREQWQKELHREMGRKEAGIAGLKEEIAETEKQLGLVSGKAAEQLQKHGQALERKVKAVETEINNLRGIERVGLVDEHGKSLAAGSGGGAAGRVKSDLVGYGLVDEKGQWNKEIFGATPEKAAAVGERVRQAEASVSRNLYVDAANRSIGSWERETVKKALGGAVDSRKKEWISRSGLLGEEREKYASSFHDNVTTLKKSGLSETQAFRRALGEVKADSLRDSAGFKEHRDWILNQVDPKDRQAVAAKLDAALNNLPKDGLAKAGFTGDYQVQLLAGQAQAGQAPDVVLKVGASRGTYTLQPSYDQAFAQTKEMAAKYGLADEVGKWHATWQSNPLRATTQLLLGETGTGVLWGDSKYLVKALPGPLGKFFQPEKYLLSTEARGISTLYKDFKREGTVRFVVARTLGSKLGLYHKVAVIKGEKILGYKYVGAANYFTSGLLHTVVTSPFRLPAGALDLVFSKSALSKFGFAQDITKLLVPLLKNPGYGGLLPWAFNLAKVGVQIPLNLVSRTLTRINRNLAAWSLNLLRRTTWGRNVVSFVRGLPGKLGGLRAAGALRLGSFLTGTKLGRFMSGAGKVFSRGASSAGVLVKGAGKGLFGTGSLAYGLLSGRVGVPELGLMLADKLRQMIETGVKRVATVVMGAVAKAIGISLGWVLAGCALVGCLVVLIILVVVFLILGYCPYFPDFILCRYFFGWKPRAVGPPPAALQIMVGNPPSFALNDPLAVGGTVLPVTAKNTSAGSVMVSGVTGDMSYITAGEGRGAANFNSIKTGTEGWGSFTLSDSQITDGLLDPKSRYVSSNNVVLNSGEKADFVLRVSGLRTDQDATYVTNLRFLYYEGTDSTLPLQETHGIVEVRIGAGVSFGDDLFVQKINSLATCVTSDSVAYRVFSQECVPECAASLWNPWFNNLQCAVFIEGGQNCSGIKPIFGDAYQWFGVASRREDMAVYTNGAQCPRRGDVIVWQGGSQGWGHVAVVTDDGGLDRYDCSGRVEITQANTPRIKMNLNVYQGWIRAEGFEAAGFSLLGLIRRASF